ETQAQLVLSERMAGLGLLVAGVAHEINSPTAAIRGSIDGLTQILDRLARHGAELAARTSTAAASGIARVIEALAPSLAERPLATGVRARKAAREIGGALEAMPGPLVAQLPVVAMELADLGATPDEAVRLIGALGEGEARAVAPTVVAALTDHVYLQRTASTIRHAVASIQRIVGALKRYSHLDHQAVRTEDDVHDGLETTLALLHHALRDIVIERRYATLPRIPVFVDELNQVWTNLIQNAQQALASTARARIEVSTAVEGDWAVIRVADNGPGVPADAQPRIFEPFFTTKPKGEGTGLGLGIARQIVQKHGGTMRCESEPGRTVFEVRLPVSLP
ncbi:MAG TPA: ATP-binding protein, partial [Kofleriaceae bacterium]